MNKNLLYIIVVLVLVLGGWYWFAGKGSGTQTGPTPTEVLASRTYHDAALGFSIILPTAIATTTSDSLYSVDTAYEYAMEPGKSIAGVKFTIPRSRAAGTNLGSDSYVSVEHLPAGSPPAGECDAAAFLPDPSATAHPLKEMAIRLTQKQVLETDTIRSWRSGIMREISWTSSRPSRARKSANVTSCRFVGPTACRAFAAAKRTSTLG